MRRWPLHILFAILLIGSLAARARTPGPLAESRDFEAAVRRVARAHGLAFRGYTTLAHTDVRALAFQARGCSRPALVALLSTAFDAEPMVRSIREPGFVLRYVYVDRSWDRPRPLAVTVEHIKYAALATFGLTRYAHAPDLLLIESPSRCQDADAVDWRDVWNRDPAGARQNR